MGLFKSKEEKEQKREQKVKRFLAQHDLDDLNPKSYQLVKNIMSQNGLIDLLAYSLGARIHGSDAENMIINNLQTIVEQNWLLIKQNDTLQKQNAEIINNLKNK
ncbi:hypothetical protein [Lentilactobacillus parabuchneri]|uniref:hypothetical protein n=1 Tax=Lentilactobacillus parabuchneri TaxID=152331 RepID=UPI000A110DAD|nr:hypothetical protein [Lentilactobacillus parabuchneri]ORN13313.1 hypothetical protein FAM23164_02200 [Lentilactobacillus parabuchneri]ORN14968.1 hypothetical protein FAM23165_02324 [Lentilactobacillus parabuchneri]ORN18734.1 hypothetical protein FAM23166_01993 [Lentilactobacillus parabuchneri]ORN23936.1 hypothetical protein FAM23167_02150 [Lentilactobacillus parabuchneri]